MKKDVILLRMTNSYGLVSKLGYPDQNQSVSKNGSHLGAIFQKLGETRVLVDNTIVER